MSPVFTLADQMPWPVAPTFQMLPGMQRHTGPLWIVSEQDSAYQTAKRRAWETGRGQVGHADPRVLEILAQRYDAQTGHAVSADVASLVTTLPEDFVILHDEPVAQSAQTMAFRARFISVCFASNWNPADKLGMTFAQIHAPVADNTRLLAAQTAIESMAFRQTSVRRHVWLLSPNPLLRQDPEQRRYSWQSLLQTCGDDDRALLSRVMFRVERQTTLPLPELARAVFLIRVLVCPLHEVLALERDRAETLAAALASMSEAVLAYRGLQAVQARLIRALVTMG